MESYFDVMAQNPHCLLAVDAQDGGKWKSPFQLPHYISYAQNPKSWTDFNSFFNTTAGIKYTDDFEFEMAFEWNYTEEEMAALTDNVSLFYNAFGNTPIGILVSFRTRAVSVFPSGSTTSPTAGSVMSTNLVSKGRFVLKYKYSFSTASMVLVLNGVEVSSVLPTTNRTDFNVSQTNRSFFNGNIYSITLTKTTGGTRTLIWEANQFDLKSNLAIAPTAPLGTGSFEETHGLLKKQNVVAENDYFKYATNATGYIETPLDLRGYAGDFTMMAKAMVTKTEVTGVVRKDIFLMQGNSSYFGGCFLFFILQDPTSDRFNVGFYTQNSTNAICIVGAAIPTAFNWGIPHVYAVSYTANNKTVNLFIDGVLAQSMVSPDFDSFYKGSFAKTQICYKENTVATETMKQYSAMIFDRALSTDEIKILSDSMMPKKS